MSGPVPAPLTHIDLSPYNTLRLPARAHYFAEVSTREALKVQLQWAQDRDLPWLVLGGGSNVVFKDDFPGLVIRMGLRGRRWRHSSRLSSILELQAGENWHGAVVYAAKAGFRGIENLALIPGTVGAAPVQNIGAYGVELADALVEVEVLDTRTTQFERLDRDACEFGYRESIFKRNPGRYLITQVRLELSRDRNLVLGYRDLADSFPRADTAKLTPLEVAEAVVRIRRRKLPDPQELPNAGSFFKNPVVDQEHFLRLKAEFPDLVAYPDPAGMKLAAGWMIDYCGWKGHTDPRVGVHRHQALVLVNHAGGTGPQLLDLAERIQADIQARFQVQLDIEPRLIP